MTDDSWPAHCVLRRATRADSAAIVQFQSAHAMPTELGLRFDRSPDFFALLDAHSPSHETWLLLDRGAIKGMGSVVVRNGYVDGRVETIAYLGELRITPHRVASRLWPVTLRQVLGSLRERTGARFAYGCIIRSNRLARSSLLGSKREGRPAFTHWRGYSNVSILARKPWARGNAGTLSVRRATPDDSESLRQFLDEQSRTQVGGVVFDAETWQRRLTSWPGFGIGCFCLAHDQAGRLLGCLAPWDMSVLKRIVLTRMSGAFQLLRHGFNLVAPLVGKPRIGTGALPDIYLSHIAIRDRRPDVLTALLDSAYPDLARTRRYATVSLCLYDSDPLWDAMRAYWHIAVPMDLYSLWLDGMPQEKLLRGPHCPGFEIYLV